MGILELFKQGYFLTNDLQTLVMIALVEIPILKNISKLKKELKDAEEALNHVKDY